MMERGDSVKDEKCTVNSKPLNAFVTIKCPHTD